MDTQKTRRHGSCSTERTAVRESFSHHEDFAEKNGRIPRAIHALKTSTGTQHDPRTLIICLDGTGDQYDNDNSNVVNFVSCLKKHSLNEQVTYYQSGIGTYDKGRLKNGFSAAMDMAVGSGLGKLCNHTTSYSH
jgi:uncharacterized protein (DUF2235 family)